MSDEFVYQNPERGERGTFIRRQYGDPVTGQGSFDLDILGRNAPGFEMTITEISLFPQSSRIAATRYHIPDSKMLVTWTNGKTPYIYHGVDKDRYNYFVRSSPSKGQYVNNVLNDFSYNKLFPGDPYSEFVYGVMPNA